MTNLDPEWRVDWRHTQSQPSQLATESPVPHGLARTLAGHYADQLRDDLVFKSPVAGARGALAALYWTGAIDMGLHRMLAKLNDATTVSLDSRGRRDSHAAAAELRALIAYAREQGPRGPRAGEYWPPAYEPAEPTVVPWGWQPAPPPDEAFSCPVCGEADPSLCDGQHGRSEILEAQYRAEGGRDPAGPPIGWRPRRRREEP